MRIGVREKSWAVDEVTRVAESACAAAREGTVGGLRAAMSSSTERGGSGAAGRGRGGGSLWPRHHKKLGKVLVLEQPRGRMSETMMS